MASDWNKRFMDVADLVSTWSKDQSRQTAAVIVDNRNCILAVGWNGFPRGINDDVPERHERPAKYKWTEHAERNAIYNAAATGTPTSGATMYMPWYPCADCARAIIQSGIARLFCVEPNWDDAVWAEDFRVVKEMLKESSVVIEFVNDRAVK